MVDRISNFTGSFETTLSLAMGATDTTAVVQTTAGAPASPCYMTIDPENDAKREHIFFNGVFTGTSFVTTDLANRFLPGSAAGSGIAHSAGAVVRFTPVGQMFTDLHDRITGEVNARAAADINHAAAGDPHPAYQREFEKGAANGYAPLGADSRVPAANSSTPVFVGVRARRTGTAQPIANTTVVPVQFNSENFDSDGFHDNVTNNTRFTVPAGKAGKYLVTGVISYSASAVGQRQARIHKNGVFYSAEGGAPSPEFTTRTGVTDVVEMAVGDYIELAGYQSSGAQLSFVVEETFLNVIYQGA